MNMASDAASGAIGRRTGGDSATGAAGAAAAGRGRARRPRRHAGPARPGTAHAVAPILPAQSREDTDVGWGDYAERDDNDRLLRDRPPHWDDA